MAHRNSREACMVSQFRNADGSSGLNWDCCCIDLCACCASEQPDRMQIRIYSLKTRRRCHDAAHRRHRNEQNGSTKAENILSSSFLFDFVFYCNLCILLCIRGSSSILFFFALPLRWCRAVRTAYPQIHSQLTHTHTHILYMQYNYTFFGIHYDLFSFLLCSHHCSFVNLCM